MGDSKAKSFYSNAAYLPESPTQKRRQDQLQIRDEVPEVEYSQPSTSKDYMPM